jgi:exopolysaccharide biosynthesis protein
VGLELTGAIGTVALDGVGITSLSVAGIVIENHSIDNLADPPPS